MALTLSQAALLSTNDLQRGVIETITQVSPVLDRLPFMEVNGNAFAYNEEATLPGVEFRAVNAGYVESTGTVNQKTETLTILGGDADVDKFIVRTRGNLNDQRAIQTTQKVKSASFKFQDTFINGDVGVDANSFDGLKKRLIGSQVIPAGGNGIPVVGATDADRHTFFDKLDELLSNVPGLDASNGALYMNRSVLSKIMSSARRLTINSQTTESFGKLVATYNGIPLLDIGTKADGTPIIPQTETQGSSSVASSVYAVKFGGGEEDRGVTGLQNGTLEAYDLGEINDKPVFRTRIDWYPGLAVFGGKAAARLTGVLNS